MSAQDSAGMSSSYITGVYVFRVMMLKTRIKQPAKVERSVSSLILLITALKTLVRRGIPTK